MFLTNIYIILTLNLFVLINYSIQMLVRYIFPDLYNDIVKQFTFRRYDYNYSNIMIEKDDFKKNP
jgi:hypothetical protein